MARFGFRYHYSVQLPDSPLVVEERVRRQMRRNNPSDLKLRRSNKSLLLRFPSHQAHAATPQMEIMLLPSVQGGTVMKLVIGPSFGAWKFLKGVLLACSLCGLIGMALTFLLWQSGGGAWGLYLMLLGLAGWLFLYFVSEEGKRRGRDRVELLKTFMQDALDLDLFGLDRVNVLRSSHTVSAEPT